MTYSKKTENITIISSLLVSLFSSLLSPQISTSTKPQEQPDSQTATHSKDVPTSTLPPSLTSGKPPTQAHQRNTSYHVINTQVSNTNFNLRASTQSLMQHNLRVIELRIHLTLTSVTGKLCIEVNLDLEINR